MLIGDNVLRGRFGLTLANIIASRVNPLLRPARDGGPQIQMPNVGRGQMSCGCLSADAPEVQRRTCWQSPRSFRVLGPCQGEAAQTAGVKLAREPLSFGSHLNWAKREKVPGTRVHGETWVT